MIQNMDFPFIKNVIKTKSIPLNACFLHSVKVKNMGTKTNAKIGNVHNFNIVSIYVFYIGFYFPSFIPKWRIILLTYTKNIY